jgi:hypothetical protein
MRHLLLSLAALAGLAAAASAAGLYDYSVKTIDGIPESLSAYKGKTVLIVNVASK